MPSSRLALVAGAGALGLAVMLEGCGGGTTTTTTTTTTVPGETTTITTTTASPHPRTKPMSASAMADFLNEQYLGFDKTDDSSPLGVTVSMVAKVNSFYENVYCSSYRNPVNETTCSEGRADCRMSASLYNHQMIVTADGHPLLGLSRSVGVVFNQTMVETYFGKCSYIWDGSSDRKYNNGCGDGSPVDKCDVAGNAFDNICPSTKKVCTATDTEVVRGFCKPFGGEFPIPPTHGGNAECAFPGVAINYHGQDDWTPESESNLRAMVKARVERNDGHDDQGPNLQKWNEVVIDERLLMEQVWYDPALAISAIVYLKSPDGVPKREALAMQKEFCTINIMDDCIPMIEVDSTVDVTKNGPFSAPAEAEETEELVV